MAIYVDLSKALDKIDNFLLGKTLLASAVPADITLMIMHYLRNQLAKVKWQQSTSQYYFIEKGVRQGGVLSPFLFNFYINDIIENISTLDIGCKLGVHRLNIVAYADNVVLLAASQPDMELLYTRLYLT